MAILKSKDITKMNEKDINEKMKELKIELLKARVASKKGGKSNAKEIKRTIARLMTFKSKLNAKAEVTSK
jgi:ribosomal protein L29